MTGHVGARRQPLLPLVLRGPFGRDRVEALVDTGFSGYVSLPAGLISRLGLRLFGPTSVLDAAGQIVVVQTYVVEVEWLNGPRRVLAMDSKIDQSLLGTALLDRHVLEVDFGPARTVEVR